MIYNHKLINDLAWAIGAPSLLTNIGYDDARVLTNDWFEQQIKDSQTLLMEQDKSPHLIQAYLSKMPTFRLGLYFENLLAYWFSIQPNYEILKKNFVISSETTTIGELDFILRELSTGKVIHLEVAVKFYLQVSSNKKAVWLGPNLNDNFDSKMDKLFNKQIELSNKAITKTELSKHNIAIDEHWVIIKGRLFTHDAKLSENTCWLSFDEFLNYNDSGQSQWIILSKPHWLSEINNLEYNFLAGELHDKKSLERQLNECLGASPVCIAKVNNQAETKRLFITPNDWENRAKDTLG